jgi:hypothetical protein
MIRNISGENDDKIFKPRGTGFTTRPPVKCRPLGKLILDIRLPVPYINRITIN